LRDADSDDQPGTASANDDLTAVDVEAAAGHDDHLDNGTTDDDGAVASCTAGSADDHDNIDGRANRDDHTAARPAEPAPPEPTGPAPTNESDRSFLAAAISTVGDISLDPGHVAANAGLVLLLLLLAKAPRGGAERHAEG
jgi:hypothetical protein